MPPEEVQGVLGRAFSDFARDIDTAKTHLSRLAEGSVIVGAVRGMRPEDQAALATSMVPGVGDAAGLYADYTDIRENWDQVPWYDKAGMVGAAALGAVPFVPSRSQVNAGAEVAREMMTPSRTGEIVEVFSGSYAPHRSEIEPYDERGPGNIFGGVFGSTRREVAEGHGDFIKKFDVDTGMMLEQRDLDNDEISVQLAKRLGISQDEASDVLTSVKRDEFSGDNAAQMLGMSDSGEASWEMQAKIGDAARKAGYDAVELPDEHGTSILVLNDRLPQAGRLETPEVPREKIKAYHGSPHDFDKFTTEAIGTGEGAQAYGHGLYFAEAEDVARGYRDDLSKNLIKIPDVDPDVQRQLGDSFAMSDFESVADIPADWWEYQAQGLAEGGFPDLAKQLRNADVSKARLSDGSMYQVEIDASPDEFLDWDLPLSEQSDLVRKNMETLGFTDNKKAVNDFDNALLDNLFNDSSKPLPKQPSDLRGEHLYYQSAPKATNPAEASNALSGLGIKGIRYKDGNSRGADGGTSNYVVFDENLISIARKYGIAIPAAAAMLARQTGQNPQDLYEEDST